MNISGKDLINDYKICKRNLAIPFYIDGNIIGYLKPFTRYDLEDVKKIEDIARWRKKAQNYFFSQFNVTTTGTQIWLDKGILQVENRILFIIEDDKKYIFGHIGLTNINYDKQSCEIDSVLRGDKNLIPGGFICACKALIEWSKQTLKIKEYYLQVFSDNSRAINLYTQLGFLEIEMMPAVKTDKNGIVKYNISQSKEMDADKYISIFKLKIDK